MLPIRILPPTQDDASQLFAFELANRAYFEARINARAAGYYSLDAVRHSIEESTRQREQGLSCQYLIKCEAEIVGRVNLTGIVRRYYNKALLGYRIGEESGGKGIGSQAVALALTAAFEQLRLWRIEAVVRADNIGSLRVLEKNGFNQFGRARQSMCLNGVWHDLLHFERRSPHGPDAALTAPPPHPA